MSGTCYGYETPNHNGSPPDPVVLPHYGPCNPQTDSISRCCEIGHTCLTNGLCVTPSGFHYSSACTDSSCKAANCSTFCDPGRLCPIDRSLLKLMVITGLNHFPVECHGSAVKDGDFCCEINRKTRICCDTASNGLGLMPGVPAGLPVSARPDEASTVPTSVSTGTAPDSISTGAYSTLEYDLRLAS